MELHLPTFYLAAIVLTAAMGAVMSAAALANPILRITPIARSVGFALLAFVLFRFRAGLGEPVAVVLGNIAMALALSEYATGLRAMAGHAVLSVWRWAPVGLVGVASLVFLHVVQLRLVAVGVVLAGQAALVAWSLSRFARNERLVGFWFVVVGAVGCSATFVVRALLAALLPAQVLVSEIAPLMSLFTVIALVAGMVFMATGTLVLALEQQVQHNRRLALVDALTGLPNRRHALQTLARTHAGASRAQQPLAVLMMDVDYFKKVNDTYGHPAGDAVLVRVGEVLRQRLRAQDLAARFGGEEFLVLLPDTDAAGALQVAEALRQAIQHEGIAVTPGKHIGVTVSVGVCAGAAGALPPPESLISRADDALYQAKADGRNCVRLDAEPPTAGMPL